MDVSKELYVAKKAAISAGKAIMEIYKQEFEVNYKEDESPVTQADLKADEIIISRLKEVFPNYAYLSEESADDLSRLDNDYCFIIDPIDGTKEFVNKTGEFTVNIALSYKQEIVMGVIYAPVLDELYYAEINKGSFKVKEGIYTQLKVSDREENLRVAHSRSHRTIEQDLLYEEKKDKIEQVYTVGSTLKGCFLAAGMIDGFYKFGIGTKEWDIAAMVIIIEEAGGVVRDLNNNEIKIKVLIKKSINIFFIQYSSCNLFFSNFDNLLKNISIFQKLQCHYRI